MPVLLLVLLGIIIVLWKEIIAAIALYLGWRVAPGVMNYWRERRLLWLVELQRRRETDAEIAAIQRSTILAMTRVAAADVVEGSGEEIAPR